MSDPAPVPPAAVPAGGTASSWGTGSVRGPDTTVSGPLTDPATPVTPRLVDLGELGDDVRGDPAALAALVGAALEAGAARVEARVRADDLSAQWTAARAAGLRREGVLRGVPSATGTRDLALLARLADDVDPAVDALPSIVPLFPVSLLSAGVVLRDRAGRVLLLRTSYKTPWDVPGGVVEDGEGLRAGAARELAEELGLDLVPGRLLVADRCGGDGRQGERLLTLLDGGVHGEDLLERLEFRDGEIVEARWREPAEVAALVAPGLAARVTAALAVLDAGRQDPALLVDGVPEDQGGAPCS